MLGPYALQKKDAPPWLRATSGARIWARSHDFLGRVEISYSGLEKKLFTLDKYGAPRVVECQLKPRVYSSKAKSRKEAKFVKGSLDISAVRIGMSVDTECSDDESIDAEAYPGNPKYELRRQREIAARDAIAAAEERKKQIELALARNKRRGDLYDFR